MLAFAPQDAIAQLDNLVASAQLPPRDANQCSRLADILRRPARICLLGLATGDIVRVAQGFIGTKALLGTELPPAVELHYGSDLRSRATLEDGSKLEHAGWPSEDILRRDPVFLQIFLPEDRLQSMSLLVLVLDNDPRMHRPALSWAARRSEITVWCTPSFHHSDALVLDMAPERLTQHAYLIETRPNAAAPKHTISQFTGVFALADPDSMDVTPLYDRLMMDIEDARVADLDMAQLFLHRLGHLAPCVTEAVAEDTAAPQSEATHDLRPMLSEPLLFLMARAADLANQLAPVPAAEEWVALALTHCTETIEGLRDRAENWPDDVPLAQSLKATIEEICDMTMLLEIEGQAEQAQDAAALLFQLRVMFEQALGWEAT